MSEVTEQPASGSPLTRIIGVISSPGKTYDEISRSPGWIPPLVIYLVVFLTAFWFYGMKADWETITVEYMESNAFLKMAPEDIQEQAIQDTINDAIRPYSQWQITVNNAANVVGGLTMFNLFMTLVYATLFYVMGKVPDLKLGKAWLSFLAGLGIYAVWIGINIAGRTIAVTSRVYLLMASTIVIIGLLLWVVNWFARRDIEFNRMLSVYTSANSVSIIAAFAFLLTALVTPEPIQVNAQYFVKSNLGAFLDTGIGAVDALLGWLDVFLIWFLSVLAIGYSRVAKTSTGLAASIVFLPWACIMLISMAFSLATG